MLGTIWGLAAILLVVGLMSVMVAVNFGKQYKSVGMRKNKLLCVCFTVFACVCIITAFQIIIMFRNVLFAA